MAATAATRGRSVRSRGLGAAGFVVALALIALGLVVPWSARADSSITVAGSCTLPEAIKYAEQAGTDGACSSTAATGTTTIVLPAGTYTLTGTIELNTANVIIQGAGASTTTITGNNQYEVLDVAGGITATVSGVTITGGLSGNPTTGCTTSGTGIFATTSCPAETGNSGGGIENDGTLTLTNTVVSGNHASPGGLPYTTGGFILFCTSSCPPKTGESAASGGNGGGVYNDGGTLTVDHSTISGNTAGSGGNGTDGASGTGSDTSAGQNGGYGGYGGYGGGIYNDAGNMTIVDSTISANSAGAGGNAGSGSAATANGNGGSAGYPGAGGSGGGIYTDAGTLTMTGSTISGNSSGVGGNGATGGAALGSGNAAGTSSPGYSAGVGGGIYNGSANAVSLTNDTLAGNSAPAGGTGGSGNGPAGRAGAIWNSGALLQLSFDTISGNSAAGATGGLLVSTGSVTEANSIIASNTGLAPKNCTPAAETDGGHNLGFGDNTCLGMTANPMLGPLQDNGGPTQTMAPASGSPAIDEVPLMSCPSQVDQRGVGRPQGTACDAGAYELAPPSVSGLSGVATSSTGASVTAAINPNGSHTDTSVTVKYGTSSSYGSTATAQDIGRGVSPVAFSATLTGLQASTTYHFVIVATNADGTSTSSDASFSTPAPPPVPTTTTTAPPPALSAALDSATVSGSTLSVRLTCSGGAAGGICSGPLTLSSRVTTQGKTIVKITADAKSKPKPKPKPKTVVRTERVGAGSYSLSTGQSATVKLKLNKTGLALLAARYSLPAKLTLGGSAAASRTLSFRYSAITSPISFTWNFGPASTTAQELGISSIPTGSRVLVICHGAGCPFSERAFAVKRGRVSLTAAFAHHSLRPHATVEIEISHPNDVGKVVLFTVRASAEPSLSESCLVPGAHQPSLCVR